MRTLSPWLFGMLILVAPWAARPAFAHAADAPVLARAHHAHAHPRHHHHAHLHHARLLAASLPMAPTHPASLPRPNRATAPHHAHSGLERPGKGSPKASGLPERFTLATDVSSFRPIEVLQGSARSKPRDVMASRGPPRAGPVTGTLAGLPPAFANSSPKIESPAAPFARRSLLFPTSAAVLVARAPILGAWDEAVSDFPGSARAVPRERRRGGAALRAISASEGVLS